MPRDAMEALAEEMSYGNATLRTALMPLARRLLLDGRKRKDRPAVEHQPARGWRYPMRRGKNRSA